HTYTHTHTHTHIHTPTHTHIHIHTLACTHSHAHTHTPIHIRFCSCSHVGCPDNTLVMLRKAVELKLSSRQQLIDQLEMVEEETRSKLQEMEAFNTQLKVCLCLSQMR